MQIEVRRGTIEERAEEFFPTAVKMIGSLRRGGCSDGAIREEFARRHRERMREYDAWGADEWADNESVAVAAWLAFEAAMVDPRTVPDSGAGADAKSLRDRIRSGLKRLATRSGRPDRDRARSAIGMGWIAARSSTRGPAYAESFRLHVYRIIDEELAAWPDDSKDDGCVGR